MNHSVRALLVHTTLNEPQAKCPGFESVEGNVMSLRQSVQARSEAHPA